MLILGIETSCDETAASVVEETGDRDRPWAIRSSIVASQVAIHREWGGVVPELASRQHIRDICGVVERALHDASATWHDGGSLTLGSASYPWTTVYNDGGEMFWAPGPSVVALTRAEVGRSVP